MYGPTFSYTYIFCLRTSCMHMICLDENNLVPPLKFLPYCSLHFFPPNFMYSIIKILNTLSIASMFTGIESFNEA